MKIEIDPAAIVALKPSDQKINSRGFYCESFLNCGSYITKYTCLRCGAETKKSLCTRCGNSSPEVYYSREYSYDTKYTFGRHEKGILVCAWSQKISFLPGEHTVLQEWVPHKSIEPFFLTPDGIKSRKKIGSYNQRLLSKEMAAPAGKKILNDLFGVSSFSEYAELTKETKASSEVSCMTEYNSAKHAVPDLSHLVGHTYTVWSRDPSGVKYAVYCPKTKATTVVSQSIQTCPLCKEKAEFNSNSSYCRGITFEAFGSKESAPEKALVVRCYSGRGHFSCDNSGLPKLELDTTETARFYDTGKKRYYYDPVRNAEKNLAWGSSMIWGTPCQSESEIHSVISDTALKYSGVEEAFRFVTAATPRNEGIVNYLSHWHSAPAIKLLLLYGFEDFAINMVMSGPDAKVFADKKATKPHEILGISRPKLKLLKMLSPDARTFLSDYDFVKNIPEISDNDMKIFEEFLTKHSEDANDALKESFLPTLKGLICDNHINIESALSYLDNVDSYQCMPAFEAAGLWNDYLRMAKELGYRLDNKATKYPHSLYLEHSKAVYAMKAVNDSGDAEAFRTRANDNLVLEYSFDDMFIKIPTKPQELVDEGRELKHCCKSYIRPVQDGKSIIAFIRKKDAPDAPFYTALVSGRTIQEVSGYCNSAPSKEVVQFVKKWAAFKKLAYAG